MDLDLDTGKNICSVNNDDEAEGEAQMDHSEDDEDDDEPDFMDNLGKCWEFECKIRDEKHLKEWCQNKMGGMIVGKEEKLTRQFHCPIKECQFKAILLKSCSIVYTRNKHNHQMQNERIIRRKNEERDPEPNVSDVYVDIFGKTWPFHAQIGKNIAHDKLLTKFGFNEIRNNGNTTIHLYCTKINPGGGKCPFSGIYLKSNGCLYTRGQHEHTKRGKTPQNIGEDYMDRLGNIWKFNKEIGKNIRPEMLRKKFGFTKTDKKGTGLYLRCTRRGSNGNVCKFVGIYLKSNGCLYTRRKHNHEHIEKNPKPNVGDVYVDYFGKIWPFHVHIGKNISHDKLLTKFGFSSIHRCQRTLNLFCQKRMANGRKCPYRGIFLNSNGCLYIRGKHEHKY